MNVVFSYFVSHPNEFRSDARTNILDYLSGALDEELETEDDRPIVEQATDMLDAWAEFDKVTVTPTPPPIPFVFVEPETAAQPASDGE